MKNEKKTRHGLMREGGPNGSLKGIILPSFSWTKRHTNTLQKSFLSTNSYKNVPQTNSRPKSR